MDGCPTDDDLSDGQSLPLCLLLSLILRQEQPKSEKPSGRGVRIRLLLDLYLSWLRRETLILGILLLNGLRLLPYILLVRKLRKL